MKNHRASEHGQQTFQQIEAEYQSEEPAPEQASNIGRAYVPRPRFARVDSLNQSDDQPKWNRTQQVRDRDQHEQDRVG